MKTQLKDKDVLTVQETVEYFELSRRKFYALLKEEGLHLVAFYYSKRRLILRTEFAWNREEHPEIRKREPRWQESQG